MRDCKGYLVTIVLSDRASRHKHLSRFCKKSTRFCKKSIKFFCSCIKFKFTKKKTKETFRKKPWHSPLVYFWRETILKLGFPSYSWVASSPCDIFSILWLLPFELWPWYVLNIEWCFYRGGLNFGQWHKVSESISDIQQCPLAISGYHTWILTKQHWICFFPVHNLPLQFLGALTNPIICVFPFHSLAPLVNKNYSVTSSQSEKACNYIVTYLQNIV